MVINILLLSTAHLSMKKKITQRRNIDIHFVVPKLKLRDTTELKKDQLSLHCIVEPDPIM